MGSFIPSKPSSPCLGLRSWSSWPRWTRALIFWHLLDVRGSWGKGVGCFTLGSGKSRGCKASKRGQSRSLSCCNNPRLTASQIFFHAAYIIVCNIIKYKYNCGCCGHQRALPANWLSPSMQTLLGLSPLCSVTQPASKQQSKGWHFPEPFPKLGRGNLRCSPSSACPAGCTERPSVLTAARLSRSTPATPSGRMCRR